MSGRAHSIMILLNLRRVMFLLIIPALHGVFALPRGGFLLWLRGAWLDALTLVIMLTLSVLMWRRCNYKCTNKGITVCRGLFFSHCTTIKWSDIITLSCGRPFFLRMFNAVFLRADTIGGSFRDSDIRLLLNKDTADKILDIFYSEGNCGCKPAVEHNAAGSSVLAFALLSSSALTGIVFAAAVVSQSGKLLGQEFSDMLVLSFEEATRNFALGIPPAAAAITYILLLGWLIGVTQSLWRYWHLRLKLWGNKLIIESGKMGRRLYAVNTQKLAFADIRQTLGMHLAGVCALYISAVGYGKHKDDISCVIPTMRKAGFMHKYFSFFAALPLSPANIKPPKRGFMPFIIKPLCMAIAIMLAGTAVLIFVPHFSDFIIFIIIMLTIPSVVLLAVGFSAYFAAGVGYDKGVYTLRYSRGFALHTVIMHQTQIAKLEFAQNIFQRRRGMCHLVVFTKAEHRNKHKCLNLSLEEIKALMKIN